MKIKYLWSLLFLMGSAQLIAQSNINQLLASGLEDAKQFSDAYTSPASSGLIFSLSNGWFNTAKSKNLGEFEISIIGNASFVGDDQKHFHFNESDYNFLHFKNPALNERDIATIFGQNDPAAEMLITYEAPNGTVTQTEITLPQGLGSVGVSTIPTAYLQASVGILKGTEVKLRYLPKIELEKVSSNFYGAGIQHELTSWIPGGDIFPLHIAALVGYTAFKGSHDLTPSSLISGSEQRIETQINSWLFAALVSTKLPVINFYGGLGYVTGKSTTDLLGKYRINAGVLKSQTLVDPYSITHKAGGIKASLGFKLKLAFFRLNAAYSFQKFNSVSLGLNFGI